MCLYIGINKIQKAESDIKCYKIVVKFANEYYTPIMNAKIDINNTFRADGDIKPKNLKEGVIREGMVHVYKTKDAAIKFRLGHYVDTFMYECIIPKGTEYIEGLDDDLAAKEIRFIRRVYDFNPINWLIFFKNIIKIIFK